MKINRKLHTLKFDKADQISGGRGGGGGERERNTAWRSWSKTQRIFKLEMLFFCQIEIISIHNPNQKSEQKRR